MLETGSLYKLTMRNPIRRSISIFFLLLFSPTDIRHEEMYRSLERAREPHRKMFRREQERVVKLDRILRQLSRAKISEQRSKKDGLSMLTVRANGILKRVSGMSICCSHCVSSSPRGEYRTIRFGNPESWTAELRVHST